MHDTHERHLDQIEEQLLGIEVTLSEKLVASTSSIS
jgi:hypothetical protein